MAAPPCPSGYVHVLIANVCWKKIENDKSYVKSLRDDQKDVRHSLECAGCDAGTDWTSYGDAVFVYNGQQVLPGFIAMVPTKAIAF